MGGMVNFGQWRVAWETVTLSCESGRGGGGGVSACESAGSVVAARFLGSSVAVFFCS